MGQRKVRTHGMLHVTQEKGVIILAMSHLVDLLHGFHSFVHLHSAVLLRPVALPLHFECDVLHTEICQA
jgi:hypothetical protein